MDNKKSTTPLSRDNNKSAISDAKSGAGTAKSKGKGKRAKVKEEEERKRLEEEAQLRKEQEEKERREKLRVEKEQSKQRELKIKALKKRELTEFYDIILQLNAKIQLYHKNLKQQAVWNRYIKCDGSPNPTLQSEINTFLTLWREDHEQNDIENSIKNTDLCLKLVDELRSVSAGMDVEEDSIMKADMYNQTIANLENVLIRKINEASHKVFCDASKNLNPETLNFEHTFGSDDLFYCFWANLSHNPKNRDIPFSDRKLTIGLPRPLTLAHVAMRILFMSFDIFSSRCLTFKCRAIAENYDFDPIPDFKAEPEPEVKKEPTQDEDDMLPPELRAMMEKTDMKSQDDLNEKKEEEIDEEKEKEQARLEEEKAKLELEKKRISQDEMTLAKELSDDYVIDLRNYLPIGPILDLGLYKIPPQPKKVKQWTIRQKDHTDVLENFAYPSSELNLIEISWKNYLSKKEGDKVAPAADSTDANKKVDLNSTTKSDVLESTVNVDDTLNSEKSAKNKQNEIEKTLKAEGPVSVSYKLPTNFYYVEDPKIARWDPKKEHWRTDEILDLNFENGEVSFKTYHFTPYCFLQDRHVNMPIQSWSITPRKDINQCVIKIEASSFEITIEIKLNEARVYLPPKKAAEEDPKSKAKTPLPGYSAKKAETPKEEIDTENQKFRRVVEQFANKWLPLEELIKKLKFYGLNLFPEPDSEKFVSVTTKNKKIEWLVYKNMSLCSCLMAFSYNRFNSEVNDENKIVISSLIHTNDNPANADKFSSLICTKDIFKLSESNDSSDALNENCAAGTEEHADLFHLCCELCKNNEQLVNRITQIDPLYYETCFKFLDATKLVTYS